MFFSQNAIKANVGISVDLKQEVICSATISVIDYLFQSLFKLKLQIILCCFHCKLNILGVLDSCLDKRFTSDCEKLLNFVNCFWTLWQIN